MNAPYRENHRKPGKLWSLWDMRRFNVSALLVLNNMASYFAVTASAYKKGDGNTADAAFLLREEDYFHYERMLDEAWAVANQFSMSLTAISIERLRIKIDAYYRWQREHKILDRSEYRIILNEIQSACNEVTVRMRDEMSLKQFFAIDSNHLMLFEPQSPLFGQDVFDTFPEANGDIAEAGKCLALQRGTAAVFHLMRVLESGLKKLADQLGIPYAPSWESYTSQLTSLLEGKNYGKLTDEQRKKIPFYRNCLGDIQSIKIAWRNPTMHIVNSYSLEEATIIFDTSKQFMKHICSGISR
jgi:hypothetical protein